MNNTFTIPIDKISGPVIVGRINIEAIDSSTRPIKKKIKKKGMKILKRSRETIYNRDGNCCLKCGTDKNLTIDHIKPLSKGGKNRIENYQTLCSDCNCSKGNCEVDYRNPIHIGETLYSKKQIRKIKRLEKPAEETKRILMSSAEFNKWYFEQPQMNFHEPPHQNNNQ